MATTLQDLTDCVATLALHGPAVIFVGLDWTEAGLTRPEAVTVYRRQPVPDLRVRHAPPLATEALP